MDPDAVLERAINAIQEGDLEEAEYAIEDLNMWLSRGGFYPKTKTVNKASAHGIVNHDGWFMLADDLSSGLAGMIR